jgi:hypothetical protein
MPTTGLQGNLKGGLRITRIMLFQSQGNRPTSRKHSATNPFFAISWVSVERLQNFDVATMPDSGVVMVPFASNGKGSFF